ncbi:MAG: arylsulfatase [Dolichospermum sp. DET50]|nr:arylsulfatase [Dolichospermum sp. DET66]MBS3033581.1 arylsulfatase [Dolichospermum sp. DET67]MBS3038783.1 arylsulfatase [Dolichospermum sp. DET50]QSX66053.1 MAG: arylsulfatase [Dolichospermum sp. DET69]
MVSNNSTNKPSRDILPIPDITPPGLTTFDAKDPDTKYPPIVPLRPPKGAPNVLIVLLDDVGFGASSAFGGPIRTPVAEKLAEKGLKYNRFHTTALCSPTRSALLSGRNHHSIGFGAITEMATSAPGNNCLRPNTAAPLAEILKLNGYSTAQFGKCHEVPVWETSPMGPFTSWPSGGGGFEYFYGFIGGETNQYYPGLYEGTIPIEPEETPGEEYHLTTDLTKKAIKWVRQQKSLMPDKPFFMYFAPGACHAPHHVPKEWADKYKKGGIWADKNEGTFEKGWDKVREETFKRQKELGIIPNDAQLTDRHEAIPEWDTGVSEAMKPVLTRQMEVYAGFLEHADDHVGLLVQSLEDLGVLDDTLIYYVIGDNGASAEGSMQGAFNEMVTIMGYEDLETEDFLIAHKDKLGTSAAYNHYAVGWAHAMNTPYQWTKQVASHFGGTRNGCIVHWPNGIEAKGEIRSQFHHVIDIAPTVLELAKLPEPTFVHGVQQKPIEGVSMAYSFDDKIASDRRETQYFEMMGNRGIYHKGWTAVTQHRIPWETGVEVLPAFDDDLWELYDTATDWTQAKDLAKDYPDKLKELQRLWLIEAVKYNVVPLDDRFAERSNPVLAGRPQLIESKTQVLYGGMGRLTESSIVDYKNRSFTVEAELNLPLSKKKRAEGVIIAIGGSIGGWSLYAKNGKLKYCYNFFGLDKYQYYVEGDTIPFGISKVRMEFAYDGGGLGKGGSVSLFIDDKKVGEGRVDQTEPSIFSADETCDIGFESGSPVTKDYDVTKFNGEVNWVKINVSDGEVTRISPELRLRIAVGIQ